MESVRSRIPFHYGWVIVGTGTLCIFACLGLGRFALGMLLPSMASSLSLSYAEMGYVSTGNFVGYLFAVLVSGSLTARLGARKLVSISLLIIALSMLAISRISSFFPLLMLYAVTGMGSGFSNVPLMALVATWFRRKVRGKAAGFVVIGSGFAIIISGKLIPFVNRAVGQDGWRLNWAILGSAVLLISLIAVLLLRNRPEELGLEPVGTPADASLQPASRVAIPNIYREKIIYLLGAIYFLFGYTYVIYATFIVTSLVKERGFSEVVAGNFWSWVGLLSLLSGPIFGTLSDRFGRRAGLMTVFAFQMTAYLLAAFRLPDPFLYLSIFCYGIVAWSIPSIMIAAVGDYMGSERTATAFGFVTFIFGFGQISGPAIAGVLAEKTGSFSSSFIMAAFFAGAAIVLAASIKRPSHH